MNLGKANMRALVIDDSRAMRKILINILTEIGWEVFEANNGREGLIKLEEIQCIELILVDWNMPEMNGYEFIRMVRTQPDYDRVRLIMVTTETGLSQVSSVLKAGANEYIMKPFTREVVLEKLGLLGVFE